MSKPAEESWPNPACPLISGIDIADAARKVVAAAAPQAD